LIDALLLTGRQLFVPKVRTGQRMHLVELCPDSSLRRGRHGIAVPAATLDARCGIGSTSSCWLWPSIGRARRLAAAPAITILLAVATRLTAALLVGYAYAIQQHPQLPEDVWDRRSTAVITERTYFVQVKPMHYWLMKTEPDSFGHRRSEGTAEADRAWNGVRNFQARNSSPDAAGDLAFFYHPAARSRRRRIAQIASERIPTDAVHPSRTTTTTSRRHRAALVMVDVRYQRHLKRVVPLSELRKHESKLQDSSC